MNLIAPDGQVGWVEDDQVPTALKQGFRQATADDVAKAKAADQPVQAGLEGVARGATAGISDAVLTGYYKGRGADPRQVLERKEENPAAALTGEIAGIMAPGAGTAITAAGTAVKGVFAGKAAGRLAQGVVEGGLWGLGSVISEDALQDRELTGENLAAGTVGAALVGGATNVAFGKVGDVTRSALVKAFGGSALKDSLEDLAATATMRQVTLPSDRSKDFLRKRSQDIGKFVNQEGITKGAPTMAEVARRASDRAGVAAKEIDDAIQNIDMHVAFDPSNVYSRVYQEIIQPQQGLPSKAGSLKAIDDWLNRLLDPDPTKRVQTFRQAWEETSAMRAKIKSRDPEYMSAKEDFFKARGILQDEIFSQAGAKFPDWETMMRRANDDLAKSSKFSELAGKAADRQTQNRGISLTDYIVGSSAGHLGGTLLGPAGVGVGVAGSLANKFMRERGGFVAASALEAMANSKVLDRLGKGLAKSMEKRLKDDVSFGGTFRTLLETSMARGASDLLATHVGLAQTDPNYLPSIGATPEDPGTLGAYADKAHRLGLLENSNDTMQAGIDKAVARVVGKAPGKAPAAPQVSMSADQYQDLVVKLRELQANSSSISKSVAELAPITAGMASMTIQKASQFLLSKAPKDPNEFLPPALHRPWAPTKNDLATWNRYVRGVTNPASVFEDINHGLVTPEGMEAIRTVYPRLFKEFKDRMMNRLSELKEPLDRKKRAKVQVLLGDLDDPRQVGLIQAMHGRTKPAPTGGPDGREKLDVQRNLLTQGQRLENKERA